MVVVVFYWRFGLAIDNTPSKIDISRYLAHSVYNSRSCYWGWWDHALFNSNIIIRTIIALFIIVSLVYLPINFDQWSCDSK